MAEVMWRFKLNNNSDPFEIILKDVEEVWEFRKALTFLYIF